MLVCNKCKGKVIVDHTFDDNNIIELACLLCGKRWFKSKERSAIGRWLGRDETSKA